MKFLMPVCCLFLSCPLFAAENPVSVLQTQEAPYIETTPVEDLMREHGVLRRILLIYEEISRRIDNQIDFDANLLQNSANIIRTFIENYHEKLEEEYLFPVFIKKEQLVDLVIMLKAEHMVGRLITGSILAQLHAANLQHPENLKALQENLKKFINLYRPHAAREDTVLFPAFKKLISKKTYDELGELFEKREQALFGPDGFENMVNRVAAIEQALNIYALKAQSEDREKI